MNELALNALLKKLDFDKIESLTRLSGGASQETWRIQICYTSNTSLILRLAPLCATQRAAGSAGLANEAALLTLAHRHGLPVPRVHHVCTPEDHLGDGYLMQDCPGETLGQRIARHADFTAARTHLAYDCGHALARIHALPHALPPAACPPLRTAFAREELAHYEAQHRAISTPRPVFEVALRWLREHMPSAPAAASLVHGDFRNGNLVVTPNGLSAILDWELAHFGDPMEDLGWISVNAWRFGQRNLPVGGFGTREQLFAGYTAAGGTVDAERVRYWEVLGTLKWGIICEGMGAAFSSGAEPTIERAVIGRRASETEIDLLDLLVPRT